MTYRQAFDSQDVGNAGGNAGFGSKWTVDNHVSQSHALSETRSFSANLINEFRGSFTRKNAQFLENDPATATVTISGLLAMGGTSIYPQGRLQDTYQFQNIATLLKGRHSLKMGGDYRRLAVDDFAGANTRGTWLFGNLTDFMNNRATSVTQAVNTASSYPRQNLIGLFFQDDFKITRDLTLNLGVRYEYNSVPFGFFGATDPQIRAAG